MLQPRKRIPAVFYRTEASGEPVREWLKSLNKEDKRAIGEVDRKQRMVLLHAFIKKSQKTPEEDLALASGNKAKHEKEMR